ncbi:MAG: hypothetical protein ACRDT4_27015 [Micromonosporaceae bacterium]
MATAVLGGGGAAWADNGSPGPQPNPANVSTADGTVTPAAAIDTTVESKFTPISPCRIIDTRAGGGRLGVATRSFVAAGTTGFVAQGGNASGCGIPEAATAIQMSVVAVTASTNGYLVAYPDNVATPKATFMGYTKSYNTTGSGVVPLDTPGEFDFKITNYAASVHLVVDVQGYYIKPMWAFFDGYNGTLARGSRVVAAGRVSGSPGWYEITFDRDVSKCTYNATSYSIGHTLEAQPRVAKPNAVWVATANNSGAYADQSFHLTVTC